MSAWWPHANRFADAQVKEAAIAHAVPLYPEAAAQTTESEVAEAKEEEPEADPTVVHAGLTEIQEGSAVELTNGHAGEPSTESAPSTAEVTDNAANAAGESQWENGNEMTMSQEWVDVKAPQETSETESAPVVTPAEPAGSQSWADDHPEAHGAPAAAADPNDGFHQVQRNRGVVAY